MSAYQYYEFRTVRRPLTREEQAEVNTWSSRGEVTPTSAHFVYHYSGFRQNPETCLLRCFDMMLYVANWGHRRLMFRLPEKEVNWQSLQAYQWDRDIENSIRIYKKSGYVVIDIDENLEEGFEDWVEGEGVLPALTALWTDIYKGNYACLYLIWVHFEAKYQEMMADDEGADDFEDADEVLEPPVPPGMKKAATALAEFMDFWDISNALLDAAAEASSEPQKTSLADIASQIRQLSEQEKTDFLARLLSEEPGAVQMDLQKHLLKMSKSAAVNPAPPRRTMQEVIDLGERYAAQHAAEAKRQAAEKRLMELQALAKRQPKAWEAVRVNLAKRTASGYDHAVNELKDLRDLAVHLGKKAEFEETIAGIREEFGKSKAFVDRMRKVGLI